MARKKKPKPDNPEQSARFIEEAEKLDFVDDPKEAFERVVGHALKAGRIPYTKKNPKPHQ